MIGYKTHGECKYWKGGQRTCKEKGGIRYLDNSFHPDCWIYHSNKPKCWALHCHTVSELDKILGVR